MLLTDCYAMNDDDFRGVAKVSSNQFEFVFPTGSSPGHSPVLNLSKSGSGDRDRQERVDRDRQERVDRDRGERGEGSASGRSSAASRRTPQPPRLPSAATGAASPRSHSDDSDAAMSDQEEHNVKDEDDGKTRYPLYKFKIIVLNLRSDFPFDEPP